jgi:DNA helicase-2/ATP-dependent DNA helicase PcrA
MAIEEDVLGTRRGTITAPAGCGKTQLIAEALRHHQGKRPALVLTHTNAGVSALRTRLHSLTVPSDRYHVSTIDGFPNAWQGCFRGAVGSIPTHSYLMIKKRITRQYAKQPSL